MKDTTENAGNEKHYSSNKKYKETSLEEEVRGQRQVGRHTLVDLDFERLVQKD